MAVADALEVVRTRSLTDGHSPKTDADPITTEVIRHALNSLGAQMKITLRRTAFSPVIYELTDFACAVYDRQIRLLAQAEALPLFLGTLHYCVESCVARVGGEDVLEPGDILLSTYGYDIGAHPQDLAVVMPIFLSDELVGYTAIKAHHMDVGAKEIYCTDTTDNFQEGAIFPGVRLFRAGERQEDLYRSLLANSRFPDALAGDLAAQISACRIAGTGLIRLMDRYGREVFAQCVERMFDHGEAVVRAFLRSIPDGSYTAQGIMDSNGVDDAEIPFNVTVEITDGDCVVDFSDAPPTQAGPVNCPFSSMVAAARLAIIAVAGGIEIAHEGYLRPIEVRTRPGTMFHPLPPAPIFLYSWPSMQAVDVIHRALADAAPHLARAATGGDTCASIWWGESEDGVMWASAFDHFCGQGAMQTEDGGTPLIHMSCSGIRNTPAEVIEEFATVIVRRFELAPDSGGPGQHSGGLGVNVEYESRSPKTFVTTVIERTKNSPWGIFGGGPARRNSVIQILPDGSSESIRGKKTAHAVPPGARIRFQTAGGGGYGPPSLRDPEAISHDLQEGYLSREQARRQYPHAFS